MKLTWLIITALSVVLCGGICQGETGTITRSKGLNLLSASINSALAKVEYARSEDHDYEAAVHATMAVSRAQETAFSVRRTSSAEDVGELAMELENELAEAQTLLEGTIHSAAGLRILKSAKMRISVLSNRGSSNNGGSSARGYTPELGSSERKAIIDAIRPDVQQQFRRKVIFQVLTMTVTGDKAFVRVRCLQPTKGKIEGVPYKDLSPVQARLTKSSGSWDVVTLLEE